jgi:phage shock protein E
MEHFGAGYLLKHLKQQKKKTMNANKGTIIDVRTPDEFKSGHIQGSINIPLPLLSNEIHNLQKMATPIVLCCASGGRSAVATELLKSKGINCINGGSWLNLQS